MHVPSARNKIRSREIQHREKILKKQGLLRDPIGGMHITKSLSLVSEGVGLFAFLAALALRRRLDQFRITA